MDRKKKFFTTRVAGHRHRLPRAAVGAPSLGGLKARLDGAGGSLGWGDRSLPLAGGWNLVVFTAPSNPNCSMMP